MNITEFLTYWPQWQRGDHAVTNMWMDWWCTDGALYNRTKAMVPTIRRLANSTMVDPDRDELVMKNNQPAWIDNTYDDFRICDRDTGDVKFTVIPRWPHRMVKNDRPLYRRARLNNAYKVEWATQVWDWTADEDTRAALYIENLAQGRPVNDDHCVVWDHQRKGMFEYFAV